MAVNLKLKGTDVEIYGLTGAVHLNGQRGQLNGILQGDRLGVDLSCGTKALRTSNLRILDSGSIQEPSVANSAQLQISGAIDVIKSRPEIGSMHQSDVFAEALYSACVPQSKSLFERMPVNLQELLSLEDRCKSGVHLVHLAMDAVAHHTVFEYSCSRGWRVYQSFVKPGPGPRSTQSMGTGYTGLDWISDAVVGGASPKSHQLWGRGQLLGRKDVSKLLALIHVLRSLVDEVLTEELLKQLPFETPSGTLEDNFQPWVDYMNNVGQWAGERKDAVSDGISSGRHGDYDLVWMGLQEDYAEDRVLFRISTKRADVLSDLYTRVTGEVLRPPVWFSMLIFAFHKYARSDRGAVGWASRVGQFQV